MTDVNGPTIQRKSMTTDKKPLAVSCGQARNFRASRDICWHPAFPRNRSGRGGFICKSPGFPLA